MQNYKVYRGGVIPYIITDNEVEMMFMMPNDPENRYGGETFQVAKGKIEEGESDEQGAFREATEELGLFNGNIIKRHDLGVFLGRTHVYLAEVETKDMFGDPHFETKKVAWLTLEEFINIGRELHIPIVKAAMRMIQNIDKPLLEMANLSSTITQLPPRTIIYIGPMIGSPHNTYRFKVSHPQQKGQAIFGFWGDEVEQVAGNWKVDSGDLLNRIKQFATTHKTSLHAHIDNTISRKQLIDFIHQKNKNASFDVEQELFKLKNTK